MQQTASVRKSPCGTGTSCQCTAVTHRYNTRSIVRLLHGVTGCSLAPEPQAYRVDARCAIHRPALGHHSRVVAQFTSTPSAADAATQLPPAQYLLLEPPASAPQAAPDVLLLAVTGVGVMRVQFQPLLEKIQAAAKGVRCWVQVTSLDLVALCGRVASPGQSPVQVAAELEASPLMDQALQEALAAAVTEGFPLLTSATGRAANVFVLGHSLAGPLMMLPSFRAAAGFIALGSCLNAGYQLHEYSSLSDWGRPVLMLGGELDGQNRWFWTAQHAYEAAVLAQEAGPHFAAVQQPYILIPGANHSCLTDTCDFSPIRGDIASDGGGAQKQDEFAAVIGAFVSAHLAEDPQQREAAAEQLLQLVRETADGMSAWFLATGQGDVGAAWAASGDPPLQTPLAAASLDLATGTAHPAQQPRPTSSDTSAQQPHPTSSNTSAQPATGAAATSSPHPHAASQHHHPHKDHHAHHHASHRVQSNELLPFVGRSAHSRTSRAVHPQLVAKAHRFARAAQLQLAATLPGQLLQELKVVVNVHMDVQSFLYNQPLLRRSPEGGWLLIVHVLLAFNSLLAQKQQAPHLKPTAPEYWLKLKRPQAIAEETGTAGSFEDGITAQQLQERTLAAALAAAPLPVVQRYQQRGMQLLFQPDSLAPDINAKKFFMDSKLHFEVHGVKGSAESAAGPETGHGTNVATDNGRSVVTCVSPKLVTPVLTDLQASPLQQRLLNQQFSGNWYVKVMSVAQLMEWVMLDSLRVSCHWP